MLHEKRSADDETFGKRHADLRSILRIAAFDELLKPTRRQTRCHGVGAARTKLGCMTGQRTPLRLVMSADIDDERRRSGLIDEVVADRFGLPRFACRGIPTQAGTEHSLGQQLARRDMVGVPVGPVRQRNDARPGATNQFGGQRRQPVALAFRPAVFDRDSLTLPCAVDDGETIERSPASPTDFRNSGAAGFASCGALAGASGGATGSLHRPLSIRYRAIASVFTHTTSPGLRFASKYIEDVSRCATINWIISDLKRKTGRPRKAAPFRCVSRLLSRRGWCCRRRTPWCGTRSAPCAPPRRSPPCPGRRSSRGAR